MAFINVVGVWYVLEVEDDVNHKKSGFLKLP